MTLFFRIVFCLSCFALTHPISAQERSCRLIDQAGQPIPYASVHYPALRRGVLTGEDGWFVLNLEGGGATDEIKLSCLNYQPEIRTVSTLRTQTGPGCQIIMKDAEYDLERVEIVAKQIDLRKTKIGVTDGVDNAWFDFRQTGKPIETGTIMKVKKPGRIDNVNIRIKEIEADSFLIEVNLYDYAKRKEGPGRMLLKERAIFTLYQTDVEKTLIVDLAEQDIWVEDDFLVTFRMLKSGKSTGYVKMAARTKSKQGLTSRGDGQWSDTYLYPAIWAELSSVK